MSTSNPRLPGRAADDVPGNLASACTSDPRASWIAHHRISSPYFDN